MATDALTEWSDFCLRLALENPLYTMSIRKIVPDVIFKTSLDDSIELTNAGFKEGGSKLSMLKKYYYNEASIEKAKVALDRIKKKKEFGSVAFSTIGQEKKFTHHQHCIQSVSIRHSKSGELEYSIFYRAAEVVKIFTGDMVFIRDVLMPIFGKGKVCFFFSNATLNSMYVPLLFINAEREWLAGLRKIYKADKAFFKRIKSWTERYFSDNEINYSSAEVIRNHLHKKISIKRRKRIINELKRIEGGGYNNL